MLQVSEYLCVWMYLVIVICLPTNWFKQMLKANIYIYTYPGPCNVYIASCSPSCRLISWGRWVFHRPLTASRPPMWRVTWRWLRLRPHGLTRRRWYRYRAASSWIKLNRRLSEHLKSWERGPQSPKPAKLCPKKTLFTENLSGGSGAAVSEL